jgi:UDP-N-acetyl-D-mannosaminuronic acid dehydrogenase
MDKYKYDVSIIGGLGHVGLPLAIAFADKGLKVVAQDINEKVAETVTAGKLPFLDAGGEEILQRVIGNHLTVSLDPAVVSESKFVVFVIGTPVDEHLNPSYSLFRDAITELLPYVVDGQHLILRSTVFPGTTIKVKEMLRQAGKNVFLSFCPERIAEGRAIEELHTLPQIVSGFDQQSVDDAAALFRKLTDEIIVLEPTEAEFAKLMTNTWRYIQFAAANQFYTLAAQNGLDFYKIHHAVTHKYPRTQGLPTAGFAAGPCLFKDTMQLATFSNNTFFLGHSSMLVNEGLPNFIIKELKKKYPLERYTVGILGMSFKANSDDGRESLSYKLRNLLELEADRVLCTDVYIEDEDFVAPTEMIRESDIVIVGAPHDEYRQLDISCELVDIWNFYGKGGQI